MLLRSIMVAGLGGVGVVAAIPRAGIERAAWLSGCWEAKSATRTVEEQWMSPRGKTMISMSRTVRGDSMMIEYEQIILREKGEQLVYEAHPSGQAVTSFTSITLSDTMMVFEDPAHDFPQRVGYRRRGTDSLLAWIEGTSGGQQRRIGFGYARVRCAG